VLRVHLKTAFVPAGKTQRLVAAEIGMPENRLSEIVCGWLTPTPEEQQKIAAALGQSVEALFK
jgi:plasmid maintenance system antidote protein VapI